jgi:hypothetical protein
VQRLKDLEFEASLGSILRSFLRQQPRTDVWPTMHLFSLELENDIEGEKDGFFFSVL